MLSASPYLSPVYFSDQSVMDGIRRKFGVDDQGSDFNNANIADDFGVPKVHVLQLGVKTSQDRAISFISDIWRKSIIDIHTQQQIVQPRFKSSTLGSLTLDQRVSVSTTSTVDFGITSSYSEVGASWLQESLEKLAECPSWAQEEEMAEPTDLAFEKAKKLLEELANYVIDQPDVYPMQYSSIAIDFRGPSRNSGVLFVIDDDGSGVLFHQTDHSKGRLRVKDANDLLKEGGIWELKRVGVLQQW